MGCGCGGPIIDMVESRRERELREGSNLSISGHAGLGGPQGEGRGAAFSRRDQTPGTDRWFGIVFLSLSDDRKHAMPSVLPPPCLLDRLS